MVGSNAGVSGLSIKNGPSEGDGDGIDIGVPATE
jgi:hypothetical protein